MKTTIGLYAGSFDPITRGHLDIVEKALNTFDVVHIAVGVNPTKKSGLFDRDERIALIIKSVQEKWGGGVEMGAIEAGGNITTPVSLLDARIQVASWHGRSVTKYAVETGCTHLVRGLRQSSDFDDEFRYHGVCERLDSDLTMVHFICQERFLHVSSSTARELAFLGEDTSWLVTPTVAEALKEKCA